MKSPQGHAVAKWVRRYVPRTQQAGTLAGAARRVENQSPEVTCAY